MNIEEKRAFLSGTYAVIDAVLIMLNSVDEQLIDKADLYKQVADIDCRKLLAHKIKRDAAVDL